MFHPVRDAKNFKHATSFITHICVKASVGQDPDLYTVTRPHQQISVALVQNKLLATPDVFAAALFLGTNLYGRSYAVSIHFQVRRGYPREQILLRKLTYSEWCTNVKAFYVRS